MVQVRVIISCQKCDFSSKHLWTNVCFLSKIICHFATRLACRGKMDFLVSGMLMPKTSQFLVLGHGFLTSSFCSHKDVLWTRPGWSFLIYANPYLRTSSPVIRGGVLFVWTYANCKEETIRCDQMVVFSESYLFKGGCFALK